MVGHLSQNIRQEQERIDKNEQMTSNLRMDKSRLQPTHGQIFRDLEATSAEVPRVSPLRPPLHQNDVHDAKSARE